MRRRQGEIWLAALPIAAAIGTLALLFLTDRAPVIVSASLTLAVDTIATLVALAVALLGWIRYREANDDSALWRASALLVLGVANGCAVAISLLGVDTAFGMSLRDPGQLPLIANLLWRAVAATLLVVAGLVALRGAGHRWRFPRIVLWGPALVSMALIVLAAGFQDVLPKLVDDQALASLRSNPLARLPAGSAAPLVLLQVTVGLGYLAASAVSYRAYRLQGRGTDAVLAAGLVLAAFSHVMFAIHPGSYSGVVSAGDFLRLAFDGTLLAALAVEMRGDIRAIRSANDQLTRLRDAEVANATAQERAHLAREIHDGMSQELWLAKLKQGRLLALPAVQGDARLLAQEVSGAIESALAEARQAIMALRPTEGSTFAESVQHYVNDFSDRFGIPAEATVDAPGTEQLSPRARAELLRIVHEALANVRKHADATLVRVEVADEGNGTRVVISDNGRGFTPDPAGGSGYGLKSMQQRAALIGASLDVESRPRDGTRVIVQIPPTRGDAQP